MTDPSEPPPAPADGDANASNHVQRSRRIVILAVVLAVVLVVAGLVGTRILGIWGDDAEPPQATASPTPEVLSPFAGTPAEDFPEGADGIVLPPAEPVGDFTAEQVADALEQVRTALIAARLDQSMLVDHDPDGFLEALAADLRPVMDQAFESETSRIFATRIAEDAQLAPVPPRVTGTISYRATTAERDLAVIEVTTRFVWVYPFETAGSETAGSETAGDEVGSDLVVVRDELVWQQALGEPWTETSQGLWLVEQDSRAWGTDCDSYEASGVLDPDEEPVATLTQDADAIFDPEQPLDAADGC